MLVGAALSLAACLEAAPQAGGPETSGPLAASVVDQALQAAKRVPRYVDFARAWQLSGCPHYDAYETTPAGSIRVGSWVGKPLFSRDGLDTSVVAEMEAHVAGRLRGYCIFSWLPRPEHGDAFKPFPGAADHAAVPSLEDTEVVSGLEAMALLHPKSGVNGESVFDELRSVAKDHWDVEDRVYKLIPSTQQPHTQVALIDNAPYGSRGESAPRDAPHARAVTNVIRAIACPDAEDSLQIPCSVRHSAHLALPLVAADQADWQHGGYFGTRSQVAVAIWDAVMDADRMPSAKNARLILNLSIGWHADPEALSPIDLAVRDAGVRPLQGPPRHCRRGQSCARVR